LGGLTRGEFPRPRPPSGLLPGTIQRRLDSVDPLKEARYLFTSVVRNALGDPSMLSATLSWPATRDGRPVAPSPVLADLLALPTGEGTCLGDWVVAPFDGRDRRPPSDPEWDLAQRTQHLARHSDTPNAHMGFLERPPPLPASIPVTAFEQYLRCPARYAYDRLLGLRTEEVWSEELEPRRRGTALHRILEAFLLRRKLAPLYREADRTAAAARLHEVASEILDAVEAEGGFEPVMQAYARSRWLAGLIDTAPAGLLRAWLDSEIDAPVPSRPVAVERDFSDLAVGPVRLRGSIDRIDQVGGTLRITDYKTGAPPAQRLVRSGLAFQPIAYAAALAQTHPRVPLTARFLSLKRPDTLRHTTETDLSDDARQPLLEQAKTAAHEMAAGHFPTTPHGATDGGCRWCPHRRICRVDHTAKPQVET
jgi:ATP-dependent helicase/nuclease subunit B